MGMSGDKWCREALNSLSVAPFVLSKLALLT